jgi:hypothetical protein
MWVWSRWTYPHKDMAAEEAIPDVILVPPCLLVVEEGWPVLGIQPPVRVFILKPMDDAVQDEVSHGFGGATQRTCLDPIQTLQGVGEGLGTGR